MDEITWRDVGRCKGADDDIFFDDSRLEEAVEFCSGCTVQAACRDDAIWTESWGTWGGTTYRQRMIIRDGAHRYRALRRQEVVIEVSFG